MTWDDFYEHNVDDDYEHDDFVSDIQDEPVDHLDEDVDERDIIICLNCGHLAHFHTDAITTETTDICRKDGCTCQSFSPEISN